MMKSLYDISWKVKEEEYRADPALSYSTLSRFEREGFNNIDKLFDKIDTPSLTFGSAVDSIITGGQEEFDNRFLVAEYPNLSDSLVQIAKILFSRYKDNYRIVGDIPDNILAEVGKECNYYTGDKYTNYRIKLIKENCQEYYNLLYIAQDKTILSTQTYQDVCNAVSVLKNNESTRFYFEPNNPFEPEIERFYQLKFKACLDSIDYRCMFDELIVFHKAKFIQPIDLKTSCKLGDREWDFPKHYIEWNYQLQNRLYVRILQDAIMKDDYFKDFTILPYKDIIIFRKSDTPLVWDIPFTFEKGTLYFGKNKQIEMRDPFEIGKELSYYLSSRPKVPMRIKENVSNNLETWLNKL